jgi:chromosome partitioning protein
VYVLEVLKALQPFLPFIALAAAALIFPLIRFVYRRHHALKLVESALAVVGRREVNGAIQEGEGLWLKRPIHQPDKYPQLSGSIPILLIATLKGGVGKTTLATNLAAHFAMRWTSSRSGARAPLRVLLLDLDYQGSASTMTLSNDVLPLGPSRAAKLVSGDFDGLGLVGNAIRFQNDQMVQISGWTIPAAYDLAQAENRTLIEWLLPLTDGDLKTYIKRKLGFPDASDKSRPRDIRYTLAETLLSSSVQNAFDLVIIDAPPRLTSAHIQALCAATHLLVPTIIDQLSTDAAPRYLEQVKLHRTGGAGNPERAICPNLKVVGVIGTIVSMTTTDNQLSGKVAALQAAIDEIGLGANVLPTSCFTRQRVPYREHAGDCIAYAHRSQDTAHQAVREEIDGIGYQIAPSLGSATQGWERLP